MNIYFGYKITQVTTEQQTQIEERMGINDDEGPKVRV
jgi:hypothetical protein